MISLEPIRETADKLLAERRHAVQQVKDEKKSLAKAKRRREIALDAQGLIQGVAQGVQQSAHTKLAGVVSKCLQTVFGDEYEFRILFEKKRGKTDARLVFYKDGLELDPKLDSGGVVDVASFGIRVAALLSLNPMPRRLLILDEPFRHLSKDHGERVKEMLELIAKELRFQIIMVTHSDELKTGRIVQL